MRHLYSVLCSTAIIDRDTQRLTLVDIPERMILDPDLAKENTAVRAGLLLMAVFLCEAGSKTMEIRAQIRSPDGAVEEVVPESKVTGDEDTLLRLKIVIENIKYHGVGRYEVELMTRDKPSQKWKTTSSSPLWAELRSPITAASANE